MKRVTITAPVKVGGKRRMPGATLDLAGTEADELEAMGVATIDGDAPQAKPEPTTKAPKATAKPKPGRATE